MNSSGAVCTHSTAADSCNMMSSRCEPRKSHLHEVPACFRYTCNLNGCCCLWCSLDAQLQSDATTHTSRDPTQEHLWHDASSEAHVGTLYVAGRIALTIYHHLQYSVGHISLVYTTQGSAQIRLRVVDRQQEFGCGVSVEEWSLQ